MLAQSGIEYKNSHSRELLWLNCFTTTCLGGTLFARRSVRSFGEMAEPFPRGGHRPGFAGAMAMALRSVRGIFRHVHAATKNDPFLSAADGGGNQEGAPAPSWTLPGTVGRGSPVGCLLLSGVPAVRLAAERHCRREGRCGGGDEGRRTKDGRGRCAARRGRGTGDGRGRCAARRGRRAGASLRTLGTKDGAELIFGPGSGRFGCGSGGRARRRRPPGSAPPAKSAGAG